jgi:hypothetical protein
MTQMSVVEIDAMLKGCWDKWKAAPLDTHVPDEPLTLNGQDRAVVTAICVILAVAFVFAGALTGCA